MALRHRSAGAAWRPILARISLEGGNDPGSFRESDRRTLEPGSEATHVIAGAVFTNSKVRWVLTATSKSEPVIQYRRTNGWYPSISSDIFGDDTTGDYSAEPELSIAPEGAESDLVTIEQYLRVARFPIRHDPSLRNCVTQPHDVVSRILVGGYHPRTSIPQAFSSDALEEVGHTQCC